MRDAYGPECFGGSDDESHYMAQERIVPQPKPKPAPGPAVWDLVLEDMRQRDAFGTEKYGQRLVAGDGRDAMKDAYQEALDLVVYLRKCLLERDGR